VTAALGLGLVGAGRFGEFVAGVAAGVPDVTLRTVADVDPGRAAALADRHDATTSAGWTALVADPLVDAVVVTTPPATHAEIALAALEAGRHVFCEKPLATTLDGAREVVDAAARCGRALVVDHVLRYNPVLTVLVALRDELLGPVQRFAFENDASDEHLPPDHWFWDEERSGGIFVEHGVHFFDAAHLLVGTEPDHVVAITAARPDGRTDLVSATARHPGGVLATHTHGFTHPDRCERQQLRLDHGAAEVRVDGWIPLRARVDGWTDDRGADVVGRLPDRAGELMDVPGHRLGPGSGITAVVHRAAGPALAQGRGRELALPHRVEVLVELGKDADTDAKARVYAESVRAALVDLVAAARGARPRSGGTEALAALAVADAARRSAAEGRQIQPDPGRPRTPGGPTKPANPAKPTEPSD